MLVIAVAASALGLLGPGTWSLDDLLLATGRRPANKDAEEILA